MSYHTINLQNVFMPLSYSFKMLKRDITCLSSFPTYHGVFWSLLEGCDGLEVKLDGRDAIILLHTRLYLRVVVERQLIVVVDGGVLAVGWFERAPRDEIHLQSLVIVVESRNYFEGIWKQ